MIDTISIGHYNKTRAFARKRYRPYDEKELKAMQEAAPLLKFTLEKQTRSLEEQNIKHALQVASDFNIDSVIITPSYMQFFNHANSHTVLDGSKLLSALKIATTYTSRVEHKGASFVQINAGYGYGFETILMEGSRNNGAYVRDGDQYKHIDKSKDVMQHIWGQGYVAQGTRTPTAVSASEFSFTDVDEMLTIMNMFDANQLKGKWSAKFMGMLLSRTHKMRFPGYVEFLKRARNIAKRSSI